MQEKQTVIGQSDAFLAVLEQASRLAQLSRPVLVVGERGTGKELIVERLHYLSPRWDAPLLKVNCAALPESLLESELFGHEMGAFTGAHKRYRGRFERVGQGTLFLDEIAHMSLRLQEKLLRVIEYGTFERVGGGQVLRSQARVVGASNEDLPALAREGRFRADLLDRLSFAVITLPPLRFRRADIVLLAQHFALNMVKELQWEVFPGFEPEAIAQMHTHVWPGNVRELKNTVERAVYQAGPGRKVASLVLDPFASPWRPRQERPEGLQGIESHLHGEQAVDFKQAVREYEASLLQRALREHRFNQRQTARALGLSYHQLRGLLRKHGLSPRQNKSPAK